MVLGLETRKKRSISASFFSFLLILILLGNYFCEEIGPNSMPLALIHKGLHKKRLLFLAYWIKLLVSNQKVISRKESNLFFCCRLFSLFVFKIVGSV